MMTVGRRGERPGIGPNWPNVVIATVPKESFMGGGPLGCSIHVFKIKISFPLFSVAVIL